MHLILNLAEKGYNPVSQLQSQSSLFLPRLLFANRRDIRIIDLYFRGGASNIRGNTSTIVNDLPDATSLDIYYKGGVVCWSDLDVGKIQCTSFNLTATQNADPPLPFTNKKVLVEDLHYLLNFGA